MWAHFAGVNEAGVVHGLLDEARPEEGHHKVVGLLGVVRAVRARQKVLQKQHLNTMGHKLLFLPLTQGEGRARHSSLKERRAAPEHKKGPQDSSQGEARSA